MKSIPLVLQSERNECGLACLAMVIGGYCKTWEMGTLREHFQTGQQGLSLQQLLQFAQSLGFVGRGVKLEMEHLRELRQPAILHWNLDHFVVLVAVKRGGILVHDPASGRRLVSWSEVDKSFTGVALEIWPGASISPTISTSRVLSFGLVWKMVSGGRRNIAWVISLSLLLQGLLLMGPWHVQWLVDDALLAGDEGLVYVLAIAFAGILLLRVLVNWLRAVVVIHLGHGLSFLFACQLLDHLLRLPLDWFGRRGTGDIAARFGSLQPIREFFTVGAATLVVDGLVVLVSLVAMLVYAWELALIVCAVQSLVVLVQLLSLGRIKRLSMGLLVAQGTEQSHLIESIRAIQSVKVYAQEGVRLSRWQKLHAQTIDQSTQLQQTQASLASVGQLFSGAELVAVITVAGLAILEHLTMSVGMLFAFLSYRGYFSERLRSVVDQWVQVKTLQVHLQRLGDIWGAAAEPIAVNREQVDGHLQLKNVSFSHSAHEPELFSRVNLTVKRGEFVALIGPSGVGKTTLLRLMLGLVTPSSGSISVGTFSLQGERALLHRQACSCVMQQDGFFSGSILENLALFDSIDEARAWSVLQRVGLVELIARLPMGLRTTLGDIDSQFSSGQMQRLMLARALYRSPKFLFLDEGTANLDHESAAVIERLVADLTCTRVIVTHNLAFARRADRIFLLDNERLEPYVESDPPAGPLELDSFGSEGG